MLTAHAVLESEDGLRRFDVTLDVHPSTSIEVVCSNIQLEISESFPGSGSPLRSAIEAACWSGVLYATRCIKNRELRVVILSASGKCIAAEVVGFAIASCHAVAAAMGQEQMVPKIEQKDLRVKYCKVESVLSANGHR